MSNEKDQLGERGRSLEADYFRRRDQELLERARAQEAAAERRRLLSAALGVEKGVEDDALLTKILGFGIDAGTAPLLEVVPAIQVAWSDGSLPTGERAEIERILARPELAEAARLGSAMVAGWLSRQPGADLYRAATDALRLRIAHLDPDTRKTLIERIIKDGHAVAAASGGVFGIGAHSNAESEIIRQLAATLGVKS
jgi:uncharacterized tellurite resistance protein B-like protein